MAIKFVSRTPKASAALKVSSIWPLVKNKWRQMIDNKDRGVPGYLRGLGNSGFQKSPELARELRALAQEAQRYIDEEDEKKKPRSNLRLT